MRSNVVVLAAVVAGLGSAVPAEASHYCVTNVLPPFTQQVCVLEEMARDAVDDLVDGRLDPTVCPVLIALHGDYGAVVVTVQGDVYVDRDLVYDCPPYHV